MSKKEAWHGVCKSTKAEGDNLNGGDMKPAQVDRLIGKEVTVRDSRTQETISLTIVARRQRSGIVEASYIFNGKTKQGVFDTSNWEIIK